MSGWLILSVRNWCPKALLAGNVHESHAGFRVLCLPREILLHEQSQPSYLQTRFDYVLSSCFIFATIMTSPLAALMLCS